MTPLISVIIPCYNLGAYIDESIQSALTQTVQDFEILVVDDGSTDADTIAQLTSRSWPRTTIFRTPNRGLASARNYLIQRSSGRYLCALDADDKLHPQYFEKALAAFEAQPDLTFVSSRLQMFGDQTLVTPASLECDLFTLLTDCPVFSAALVRRSAVTALGGYDEELRSNEDWDLWISLLETGHRGIILPDILFYYRRRAGSLCDTCTRGPTHLRYMEYLIRKHERSFHRYLHPVLVAQDRRLQDRRIANWQIEREIETMLEPSVGLRRAELARLQMTLLEARPQHAQMASADPDHERIATLEREYGRALEELDKLRASKSWKVTSPLRAIHRVLSGLRRSTS